MKYEKSICCFFVVYDLTIIGFFFFIININNDRPQVTEIQIYFLKYIKLLLSSLLLLLLLLRIKIEQFVGLW